MKGDCYTINLDISRISIIEDILIEEENLTIQKKNKNQAKYRQIKLLFNW